MRLWEVQANQVFDTDKHRDYLDAYEAAFEPLRDRPIRLLELGIHKGGSLKMWASYFPNGQIHGFDLAPPDVEFPQNVKLAAGDQASRDALQRAMDAWDCHTFDMIIDDAAHLGHLAAATFSHLFDDHLTPGGFYCLEDWGTGYWSDWPDGELLSSPEVRLAQFGDAPLYPPFDREAGQHRIPSHDAGMVGFTKFLMDLMSAPDASPRPDPLPARKIESIALHLGVAIIRKSGHKPD